MLPNDYVRCDDTILLTESTAKEVDAIIEALGTEEQSETLICSKRTMKFLYYIVCLDCSRGNHSPPQVSRCKNEKDSDPCQKKEKGNISRATSKR